MTSITLFAKGRHGYYDEFLVICKSQAHCESYLETVEGGTKCNSRKFQFKGKKQQFDCLMLFIHVCIFFIFSFIFQAFFVSKVDEHIRIRILLFFYINESPSETTTKIKRVCLFLFV